MAPPKLSGKDWPRIRYEYEETDKPIHAICADHGISASTLRNRVRQWGWRERRPRVPAQGPPAAPAAARIVPAASISPADMARYAAAAALLVEHPVEQDDAELIVPRLQGAIARVLPAIEVTLAQLVSQAQPRERERASRTLAGLTRTLRDLNAMLSQFPAAERDENDEEYRAELQKLERMATVNEAYRRGILGDG